MFPLLFFHAAPHRQLLEKKITTATKLNLGAGKRGIIFVAIIKKTRTVTYKNVVLLSNRQHSFYLKLCFASDVTTGSIIYYIKE